LMAVTTAACPKATVPPWKVVYSKVAAHASRYVRNVPPDDSTLSGSLVASAAGLALPRAGHAQVSMNVEDYEAVALHDILTRVEDEARAREVEVSGAELVGLMPAGAAVAAAGSLLRIDGFSPARVLELRLLGEV